MQLIVLTLTMKALVPLELWEFFYIKIMTNEIVLNGKAIALMSVGINNQLTKRQKGLLKLLYECLKKNKPLNWDLMVKFFIKNVGDTHNSYDWNRHLQCYEKTESTISKHYKKQDFTWSYNIKPRIRNWFTTNMGSMILKGSILALPVIEIN